MLRGISQMRPGFRNFSGDCSILDVILPWMAKKMEKCSETFLVPAHVLKSSQGNADFISAAVSLPAGSGTDRQDPYTILPEPTRSPPGKIFLAASFRKFRKDREKFRRERIIPGRSLETHAGFS